MESLHSQQSGVAPAPAKQPASTTATGINREHHLAQQCAGSAVEHAIRCGELLQDVKAALRHGEFGAWIEAHCEFERSTATRYMRAAKQIATGVAISSLSALFPSGKPQPAQHQKDPEPFAGWTAPGWLPEPDELVLAAHKYKTDVIVCIQRSEKHPGFYDAAVVEDLADGGAIVEGARRPMHGWAIDKFLLRRWGSAASFDWQRCPADSELWAVLTGMQP